MGSEINSVVIYDRPEWWRLGNSYSRAFKKLGWDSHQLDRSKKNNFLRIWLRSRVGRRLTSRSLSLRRWGSRSWNQHILEEVGAKNPELFLIINGDFIMPETVRQLSNEGMVVAILYTDNPFPDSPNYSPEYPPAAREADVCFIWSRELKDRLEHMGAGRIEYLPFAWDPRVFPHVSTRDQDSPDVVFVGGWGPKRERYLEAVAGEFQLEIWGPDYWGTRSSRGSAVRECWQGKTILGEEASREVAGAKIALNILRDQNLPDGTNMRTFEIPGAGGFQLATRTEGAREIYPEGKAAAYFDSVDELLEQIDTHLGDAESRNSIASRAHEITVEDHTYVHRARRMLEACEPL